MIYPNDPQCKCIHMHTQYQNHQPAPDASQRVRGCEVRRLSGMLTITIGCKPSGNRGLLSQPERPDRHRRTREPNRDASRQCQNHQPAANAS